MDPAHCLRDAAQVLRSVLNYTQVDRSKKVPLGGKIVDTIREIHLTVMMSHQVIAHELLRECSLLRLSLEIGLSFCGLYLCFFPLNRLTMRVPVFPIIQRHLFQQIGFLFDSYLQESEENVEALLV